MLLAITSDVQWTNSVIKIIGSFQYKSIEVQTCFESFSVGWFFVELHLLQRDQRRHVCLNRET